jgi:hypothetical protein
MAERLTWPAGAANLPLGAEFTHQVSQYDPIQNIRFKTMKHLLIAALTTISFPAIASAGQTPHGASPALYPTKAEAEKAAPKFHCTGAHPMGDQWMPCAKHSDVKPAAGH